MRSASAFGRQLDGIGSFAGVELCVLRGPLRGLHGLVGFGAHGSGCLAGVQLGRIVAGLGGRQLELQTALVHLLVHGHGVGAQQLGHGVADGVHTVGHLFQRIQVAGQVGRSKGGSDGVGGIEDVEQEHQDQAHQRRDEGHRIGDDGVDELHHDEGAHAPQQGKLQADIAADVEGVVAIIPPAGVVELVQRPAAHQFQRTGQDDAAEVEQEQAVRQGRQGEEDDDHAEAVDGADRAVQKAAVDQLAGRDGGIDDLQTPAEAGVDEEVREDLIQRKAADGGINEKKESKGTPPLILFPDDAVFIARFKEGAGAGLREEIPCHLVLVECGTLCTITGAVFVRDIVHAQLTGVTHRRSPRGQRLRRQRPRRPPSF